MNVLALIGKIGLTILSVLFGLRTQFAATPVVENLLAKASGIMENVLLLVADAERVGEIVLAQGGTKLDKMSLVLAPVEKMIKTSEILAGKEVIDQAMFTSACQCLIEFWVRLLKSIRQKGA